MDRMTDTMDRLRDLLERRSVLAGLAVLGGTVLAVVVFVVLTSGAAPEAPSRVEDRTSECDRALAPLREQMATGVAPSPEDARGVNEAYAEALSVCPPEQLEGFTDEMQSWLAGLGPSATSTPSSLAPITVPPEFSETRPRSDPPPGAPSGPEPEG